MVLANCGQLGLDWERLSLSSYLEVMHAQQSDEKGIPEASDGLKRFMQAHTVQ
jgi:hypothetical protein